MKKKWVISGTYEQYKKWCVDHGYSPHNRNVVEYVQGAHTLYGIMASLDQFEYVGTFAQRADIHRVLERVEMCNLGVKP